MLQQFTSAYKTAASATLVAVEMKQLTVVRSELAGLRFPHILPLPVETNSRLVGHRYACSAVLGLTGVS